MPFYRLRWDRFKYHAEPQKVMAEVSVTEKREVSEATGIRRLLKAARRMTTVGAEKTAALAPTMQNNLVILSTCGCGSCPRCAVNAVVVTANTVMALVGLRRKERKTEHEGHGHSAHEHKHE